MVKYFSTQPLRFGDSNAALLVDNGVELAKQYTAIVVRGNTVLPEMRLEYANVKVDNYEKDNADFMEAFAKYCVSGSGFEWTDISMVREPSVRNRGFMDRFYGIMSSIITPVAPAVVSTVIMNLAETRDIALGETAHFRVESNELFQVNEMADGISTGAVQRLYAEEFTVNPSWKEISVDVDWLFMATGKMDFGAWAYKIGLSFAAYLNKLVYKGLVDGIATMPAAYKAAGYSDSNFVNLAQRVKAANANAKVYCYGTLAALGGVLPSNDYLKMQLGEEWFKNGYVGVHKAVPMMEIDQTIVPGTVNTTGAFGIDDNYLWFFALGGYKPIKLVFEGQAVALASDATQNVDMTQRFCVKRKIGSKLIVGSRYATLTL